MPNKRQQLQGTSGKLEVYPLQYVHPSPLDRADRYFVELVLSGSQTVNQSLPKLVEEDGLTINLKDIRALPINDPSQERALTLRLLSNKGVEVATSEIKNLQTFYVSPNQMMEIKNQKFDVKLAPEQDETKIGLMRLKFKFVPSNGEVLQGAQEEPPKAVEPPKEEAPAKTEVPLLEEAKAPEVEEAEEKEPEKPPEE